MEMTMEESSSPLQDLLRDVAVMIVVRDLAVSIDFYQHKLGFMLLEQQAHIAALRLGTLQLYLFTHSPPTPDKPTITLTNLNGSDTTPVIIDLLVSDCQAAYERLQARGVRFLTPPHSPPWGGLRCFARDPDGYLIEVEENAASPFLDQSSEMTP
jgi:catechol 2,3-dioxygenase-like lactoylglutathione lyase family enzyme